jgi:hypothetical protein
MKHGPCKLTLGAAWICALLLTAFSAPMAVAQTVDKAMAEYADKQCKQEEIAYCQRRMSVQESNASYTKVPYEGCLGMASQWASLEDEYLQRSIVQSNGAADEGRVGRCIAAARAQFAQTKSSSTSASRVTAPQAEENAQSKIIVYGPNRKSCLKHGMTKDGYITYTNVCKTTVEFGYCNVLPANENDGTTCRASQSAFSRTQVNYVTQSGGLGPGQTHTFAYRYPRGQTVFMVACPDSFALIESFDSAQITTTSKASASCWRFSDKK